MGQVNMLKSDFEAFKIHQYCDNPLCGSYGLVGEGNLIRTVSFKVKFVARPAKVSPFIGEVKAHSDGAAPLFASDDWFYEKVLLAHYGEEFRPPYAGRGRYPLAYLVPKDTLRYVQVIKKRNDKGKIIEIGEKIVYGKKEDIEAHYAQAERSKHINLILTLLICKLSNHAVSISCSFSIAQNTDKGFLQNDYLF